MGTAARHRDRVKLRRRAPWPACGVVIDGQHDFAGELAEVHLIFISVCGTPSVTVGASAFFKIYWEAPIVVRATNRRCRPSGVRHTHDAAGNKHQSLPGSGKQQKMFRKTL